MLRAFLLMLLATPALAQDPGFVTLPDDATITKAATPELLTELVVANVVGMNCAAYRIDDGTWALLTGTADKVAAAIGVKDSSDYDAKYFGPAFDLLNDPATCDSEGPKIALLVDRLREMGGDTTLLRPLGE